MLLDGDLNVATWTVCAAAVVVDDDVVVGEDEFPVVICVLDVDVDVVGEVLAVLVTTTVVVPPPQPASRAPAASNDAPIPGLMDLA